MTERLMTARQGREKQRYTSEGTRIVAGCVVLNEDKTKILVISSESHPDRWVLPKGGAEIDETIEESALRETWEESGAIGKIVSKLGEFWDPRPAKTWTGDKSKAPPSTLFHMFEAHIESLEDDWPEKYKRRRKWMSWEEARSAMLENNRQQLAEALSVCSIAPVASKSAHSK